MNFEANAQINIERAVLSSYIYYDEFCAKGDTNPPVIDHNLFTVPFHRRIMERINEVIKNNGKISIVCFDIQDKLKYPSHQNEWLAILATNHLPQETVKHYVERLKINMIKREIG
jgi:hypothetical protein